MIVLIYNDNAKLYYTDKRLKIEHNSYGPAYLSTLIKKYYRNGNIHNELGPAIIWCDGIKIYYLNGKLQKRI